MADRVLFLGWNRPVAGREKQAAQLFQKALETYGKLQADGQIESFEPVILAHHGGDMNGFILIRGEADKLAQVRESDDFVNMTIECGYCLEGFGLVQGYTGNGVAEVMSRWMTLIGK